MITIFVILGLTAFVIAIIHAMGKCPLWPGVLVLAVAEMLRGLPLGR
jgi:hypothetical protein